MSAGLDTFAKVRALHDRTDNPGEKAAAARGMKVLAKAAGLTVAQAKSKLDTPQPKTQAQATADAFNAFFNSPEMRARRAEQDRERQVRRAEILARYGSGDAVCAETEREAALRIACEPMTVWDRRPDYAGSYTLDGWGCLGSRDKIPPRVRAAVSEAWPLPRTVAEAWAEFSAAEAHESDRHTMHDHEHFPALWAEVRRYVVEDLLDTLPAASIDDMLLRQSWMEHLNDQGFSRDVRRDAGLLATLRADIERMGARLREAEAVHDGGAAPGDGSPNPGHQSDKAISPRSGENLSTPDLGSSNVTVHSGQPRRTNADKRRDVVALLGLDLTDREIARRAGVSPQTVGNIRRSLR